MDLNRRFCCVLPLTAPNLQLVLGPDAPSIKVNPKMQVLCSCHTQMSTWDCPNCFARCGDAKRLLEHLVSSYLTERTLAHSSFSKNWYEVDYVPEIRKRFRDGPEKRNN